jgi:threonine synthase
MKYISTRGSAPVLDFEEAVLAGLASDGGLYVPEQLPNFSAEQIASWSSLSYPELAFEVMHPFIGDALPVDEQKRLIEETYAEFRHTAIAPLVQMDHELWILELFHGPTLAFKDFALQFLGRLLDHILEKRGQKVVILGATSGDTGSAAIEGCRHCENVDIFILHPHNRVSEVQRRQMTSVLVDNVHNLAIEGNFDDCQNIVKAAFADQSFLPEGRQLVAVNSINWARIMAQIVYYFYSALALGAPERAVSFAVPTGNFGDIFAGYLAKNMGLPIERLVIATNANDILHRSLSANDYSKGELLHSLSPSMDIMISSNYERLLFDLYDRNGLQLAELMRDFTAGAAIHLPEAALARARQLFSSARIDDETTVRVIAEQFENTEYLMDPHTAIGFEAGRLAQVDVSGPMVCLSTAHPAKFAEAVERSGVDTAAELPHHLKDLMQRKERFQVLENSLQAVQQTIQSEL